MNKSLLNVTFDDYMKLILAANKRININIMDLDVKKLDGFKSPEEDSSLD